MNRFDSDWTWMTVKAGPNFSNKESKTRMDLDFENRVFQVRPNSVKGPQ
jgi:hypothetical protein